ncbi:CLUMA_CG011498, isoform A [Clunio marinus]|uniref:CLUMA_CG011498, isoform A n=1 Tax=Clunio marinus TaxID=568069 RepID=A0A1J1IED3_9DIPT|nr:CLUMA_CG011498, isoform A [Clunio marinus]
MKKRTAKTHFQSTRRNENHAECNLSTPVTWPEFQFKNFWNLWNETIETVQFLQNNPVISQVAWLR